MSEQSLTLEQALEQIKVLENHVAQLGAERDQLVRGYLSMRDDHWVIPFGRPLSLDFTLDGSDLADIFGRKV